MCVYKMKSMGNIRESNANRAVSKVICLVQSAILAIFLCTSISHAEDIVVNLKDADITAVIKMVAEKTGKNFVVDPRVKGKVTINSAKPMKSDELYQVFLAILDVHGFTALPSGNVVKIIPAANAKHRSASSKGISRLDDDFVTRVITVENVSAAQLVPIIRPLVPPQGHLAAHAQSNTLIISDTVGNISRMMRIIDRIDKPSSGDIEVIQLEHASAAEVVRILRTLQTQRTSGGKGKEVKTSPTSIVADERSNSILLGGELSTRLQLRSIVAHLDTPTEMVGDTHVIYLKYAKATDLVPVLTGVATGQAQQVTAGGKKGAPPVQASSSSTSFKIQADENTNSLVITAPIDVYRSIQSVVKKLDMRRDQVLIESVIAEVGAEKAADLGVSWLFDGTPSGEGVVGGITFPGLGIDLLGIAASVANDQPVDLSGAGGVTLGAGKFDSSTLNMAVLVQALEGDGDTNVLSTPSLVTLDNQEAEIVVGQTVPFVTGSFSSTGTGGTTGVTNPFQTISREDVGITLRVTPQINEGETVKLDIEQKSDSLSGTATGAVDLVTNTRSIKTSVMVDDGRMIVLGGLIKDDLIESVRRVPLLGSVPLLGALFRSKSTQVIKTNLMVFLKPTILRDSKDAAEATDAKYLFIRGKQLEAGEDGVDLMPGEKAPLLPPVEEMQEDLDDVILSPTSMKREETPGPKCAGNVELCEELFRKYKANGKVQMKMDDILPAKRKMKIISISDELRD